MVRHFFFNIGRLILAPLALICLWSGRCAQLFAAPFFQDARLQVRSLSSLAEQDTATVSIVYVAFPDQGDTVVPFFWKELEVVFADYFAKMSGGRHNPRLHTLLRQVPGGGCYLASGPYAQFEASKDLPSLCRDVLVAVAGDHPASLRRSDVVILAFLQDCLPGISGMAMLPCAAGAPYQGPGIVVDLQPKEMFFGLVAHEYAHLLGFRHPPAVGRKYFGDYCLMDAKVHRLVPLCVENLHRAGWLSESQVLEVTDTVRSVALGDMRKGGTVLRVFATKNQYFWVCNHQGSDYDSVYAGRGLLIWHIKLDDGLPQSGPEVWDVESAAGLWTAGKPDPVAGLDSLDISPDYTGSQADFFQLEGVSANGAHFGPHTNPTSHAYRLVPGTYDSLVQDVETGVSLRVTGQAGDTLFVDIEVPNEPPRFVQARLPLPVVAAKTEVAVECAVEDDHRVERVVVYSTQDSSVGFAATPLANMGHGWWKGTLTAEPVGGTLLYYLVASDASDRTARLPPQGWYASSVQEQASAFVMPSEVRLCPVRGKCAKQAVTLANRGAGLLLFQAHLVPMGTSTAELLSPTAQVVPHALDPCRWWDAAEVHVAEGEQRIGTVKFKNDAAWLYLRQEWYFLAQGDDYLIAVQWRLHSEAARWNITATNRSNPATSEPTWLAEPPIAVMHGFGTDAHGTPCAVMEATVALSLLETAEEGWPRLSFFAQRLNGRPQEQRAVIWPPLGRGYAGSDLALLRLHVPVSGLDVHPNRGAVLAGGSTVLTVCCNPDAEARARLVISTNDPEQPVLVVPIEVCSVGDVRKAGLFVYPNPMQSHTNITLFLLAPGEGCVAAYDVRGRLVKVLAQGPLEGGYTAMSWDGKDGHGVVLPSGVYVLRAQVPDGTYKAKVVLLR